MALMYSDLDLLETLICPYIIFVKRATVKKKILFSRTDLLVSCLTLIIWARHREANARGIFIHGRR